MLLLVGLGNPGPKYRNHRHNIGFMAVDEIGQRHNFSAAREKFQSDLSDGFLEQDGKREKAALLKPLTYMNESGRAVGEAMRFFKLSPEDVVVFHDELDLAPNKVKIKTGGGNAGHNGLKSITAHIGADFRRVRIGIGHPGEKSKVSNYVLGDFSKSEIPGLTDLIDAIALSAPHLINDDKRFASDVARLSTPASTTPPKATATPPTRSEPAKKETAQTNVANKQNENAFTDALKALLGKKDKE